MITRMIGTVDDIDIIFHPDGSGHWTTSVPEGLQTGFYIIDITVFDEAGNSSYYATKLLTFDPKALIFRLTPLNFSSTTVEENFDEAQVPNFGYFETEVVYQIKNLQQNYYFMEVTKV